MALEDNNIIMYKAHKTIEKHDEDFHKNALDDADASLQEEAEELGFNSVEEMQIAQEEAYLERRDYQVMQGA